MKTKLEINIGTEVTMNTTHSVGNWYSLDGRLHLLCNVQGRAVLIDIEAGWFYAPPKAVFAAMHEISDEEFKSISVNKKFKLVGTVNIAGSF